jgi:hypothetical protein
VKLTTQTTVVVVAAMLGMVGLILGLAVLADWSDGAIIGMVSGIGSVLVGLIVAVRNQQKAADQLDQLARVVGIGQRNQDAKMNTVVEQTNGLSDVARQDIGERAATAVLDFEERGRRGDH